MSDLFKKTRGLLSDKTFFTSLIVSWVGLTLVQYFPTEIPHADKLPNFTTILLFFSLACGFRLKALNEKATWLAAYTMVCILLLSCGFNLAVYPLLKTDLLSLIGAGIVTAISVLSSAFVFLKLGQMLNSQLSANGQEQFLRALSLGGIGGIVIFVALTLGSPGPGNLVFALLLFPHRPRLPIFVAAIVLAFVCQSTTSKFVFSPYRKFEVIQSKGGETIILGDGLPLDFCAKMPHPEELKVFAKMANVQPDLDSFRHYLGRLAMPIGLCRHRLDDVLILAASAGNDISFALKNGAKDIDAVETDSKLIELASRGHPDKPFQNPNVKLHIDDPRNFLNHTRKKYDLIEFCYINRGRSGSAPYSIERDSFTYTTECFERALKCLKPGGVIFIGFSTPGGSLAAARLHATVLSTGEAVQVAYLQHDADKDPLATKFYFFALGPGLKSLTRSDLDPLVTQFIHITSFENVPADERGACDNWPFVRVDDRERQIAWIFAIAVAAFSLVLLTRKHHGQPAYLPPVGLGITLISANYLSFASLSLINGFDWFSPSVILFFNYLCFFLSTLVNADLKARFAWLCYLISAVACGALVGLADEPIVICASSNLLILMVGLRLSDEVERHRTPSVVVYCTLIGLAVGCISAIVTLHFGLNSLGIIALICVIFSFLLEKNSLKRSTLE